MKRTTIEIKNISIKIKAMDKKTFELLLFLVCVEKVRREGKEALKYLSNEFIT